MVHPINLHLKSYGRISLYVIFTMLCLASGLAVSAEPAAIAKGSQVTMEYTLSIDGKVVEMASVKEPLTYTQGQNVMLAGFERHVEGLQKGQTAAFELAPEEGYGNYDPRTIIEIPKQPEEGEQLSEGSMVIISTASNQKVRARIHRINTNSIILDLNHPFAGKRLSYSVRILDVKN